MCGNGVRDAEQRCDKNPDYHDDGEYRVNFVQHPPGKYEQQADACQRTDGHKDLSDVDPVAGNRVGNARLNGIAEYGTQHDKHRRTVQKNDCEIGKTEKP